MFGTINRFIYQVTDGLVNYQNTIGDLQIKYYSIKATKTNTAIFDFLSSKKNANLLYPKMEKVRNKHYEIMVKKMKKIKWFVKASPVLLDLEYQHKHFTLKHTQYIFKDGKKALHKDKYAEYLNHIESLSGKLFTNISANEQLQIEGAPGSKYYQAKALSLLVRYQNNEMGIFRFKFLDKSTSYRDQGILVSFLYALSHTFFNYEHNNASLELYDLIPKNEAHFLNELLDVFSKIDYITLFREPHIGKVFEKYQYAYGPNYFFTHTIHSKEGIDISKGDILSQSDLVREQKITNYILNDQDTYNPEICYFNFIELLIKDQELYYAELPSDLYETLLDWINHYFFISVIKQQVKMVDMIEQQLKHSLTKKIKSCHLSPLDIAEKKLKQLKRGNTTKGPYRIKNKDYAQQSTCIKEWIEILKGYGRTYAFYILMDKNDECSKYILDTFPSIVYWSSRKDDFDFFKDILKIRIGTKAYNKYKYEIELMTELIFGQEGFLFNDSNRSNFYEAIEKQFDAYAAWEQRKREKNKKYSPSQILKANIKTRAISFCSLGMDDL